MSQTNLISKGFSIYVPIEGFLHDIDPNVYDDQLRFCREEARRLSETVYGKGLRNLPRVVVVHNDRDSSGHSTAPSLCYESDESTFGHSSAPSNPSSFVVNDVISTVFTVGTDCSGMEIPLMALSNMGIKAKHVFSSDKDPVVKSFIEANFKPKVFFNDISDRCNRTLEKHMDLYVAGFPCQPFSIAGLRRGLDDERGKIVNHVLHHIENHLPKIFILENVKGFTTIHNGKCVQQTVQFLKQIRDANGQQAYWVHHKVLNTADHGIPHHRLRWYCVGVLKSAHPNGHNFQFPSPISCPSLDTFLNVVEAATDWPTPVVSRRDQVKMRQKYPDPAQRSRILAFVDNMDSDNRSASCKKLSSSSQYNLDNALAQMREQNLDPTNCAIMIDVDASTRHSTWNSSFLPCITRSRYRGHWISNKNRRTTIKEMLCFQGISPSSFRQTCSDAELGKMVGNSMSVNVIERIFYSLFTHLGIISSDDEANVDRWRHIPLPYLLGSKSDPRGIRPVEPQPQSISSETQSISSECLTDQSVQGIRPGQPSKEVTVPSGARGGPRYVVTKKTRCIVDTGASDHIISMKHLTRDERKSIRKTEFGLSFQTANKEVYTDKIVDFYVEDLGITVTAYVLEDSPPLISLGKIIDDHDADYFWSKKKGAILRIGDRKVKCSVQHRCPFIAISLGFPGLGSGKGTPVPAPASSEVPIPSGIRPSGDPDTEVVPKSKRKKLKRRAPKYEAPPLAKKEGPGALDPVPPDPGAIVSVDSPLSRELKKKRTHVRSRLISSKFNTHNVFTHFPKSADCPVCQATKTARSRCSIKGDAKPTDLPAPKAFADRISLDHTCLNEDDGTFNQLGESQKFALIIQDAFTKWLEAHPSPTKSASKIVLQVQRFLGPGVKASHAYSDNSKEIIKAMEDMGIVHDTSTPNRSETNGVIERAIRRVKEGTSACLVQSGLNEEWWDRATECYCFLRNTVDLLIDGETAWKKRFGVDFNGPIIAFGSEVQYKPSSDEDAKRLHRFGNKLLSGIFIGYACHAGGGWTGDLLLIDQEEINTAEYRSDVYVKRIKAGEVHIVKDENSFIFPMIQYDLSQPGGRPPYTRTRRKPAIREVVPLEDQEPSSSSRPNPVPGEDGHGQSTRPDEPDPSGIRPSGEPDSWSITDSAVIRFHKQPRTTLFVPDPKSFPIPIKYIDVLRTTWTDLDEAPLRYSKDIWTDVKDKDLRVPWTGRTVFYLLRPKPPVGKMWAGDRLINAKATTRPPYIDSRAWCDLSNPLRKEISAEYGAIQPLVETARSEAGISEFLNPEDANAEKIIEAARKKYSLQSAPAMPVLRVYDERQYDAPYSPFSPPSISSGLQNVGFASVTGSLFRTINPEGKYNNYDVLLDGTTSTTCLSGSSVRSSSCGSVRSDSEHSLSPEPYHFRYHQDSWDRHTAEHSPQGDVIAEWFAMVHLPIPMKKAQSIPRARAAVDKEWDALASLPAWDLSRVKPKAQVIAEARKAGRTVHFGSLMDLCHEKGAEFNRPMNEKIYKGRVVFRGDQVRDETGFYAVFTEQSASASHMAAIKFMDFIGRIPGNDSEDSDAVKAYTQVRLDSLEKLLGENVQADTWITLPRERRPKSWDNIENPVCPLLRNLYGHPLAGLIWEKHCQKAILQAGFERIPGWECLFVHRVKHLFLSVYVDDFRMAGKKENLSSMWKILRGTLLLEDAVPSVSNTYLGCNQRNITIDEGIVKEKNEMFARLVAPVKGTTLEEDKKEAQQSFETSTILTEAQGALVPTSKSTKKKVSGGISTADTNALSTRFQALSSLVNTKGSYTGPIKAWVYDMKEHTEQCVERYLDLAHVQASKLQKRTTPCIDDHQLQATDSTTKGSLEPIASRVVLKILYTARLGRPDTLWSVNTLARKVTKWNKGCDKRLHRLIEYLKSTKDWIQLCFVGDHPKDCWLALFVDASFAGDLEDSKSTNGAYLCIVGPRTFVPVTWVCKRQTAVSHSSTEAEVISLDAALRMEGLPALMLWELIMTVFDTSQSISSERPQQYRLKRGARSALSSLLNGIGDLDYVPCTIPKSRGIGKCVIFEDNDAVIKQTIKGRSPNMRHVARTHRVDLDWLWERIREDPGVFIKYVGTKEQIADMFTKGSFTAEQWGKLCRLAQIGDVSSLCKR